MLPKSPVLSIDPGGGQEGQAYAHCCVLSSDGIVSTASIKAPSTKDLAKLVLDYAADYPISSVFVESVEGYPAMKNSIALIRTATIAGYLAGSLSHPYPDTRLVPGSQWREILFGKRGVTSREIAFYVEAALGKPRKMAWNEHIRDAAAMALAMSMPEKLDK